MLNLETFIGDKMLSKHEIAEEIGISIQTLETWEKYHDDFPKGIRFGRKIFYSQTGLVEWLAGKVGNGD